MVGTCRPDTSTCLAHPYFWTPSKRLAFLLDVSDRLEPSNCKPSDKALKLLEQDSQKIIGTDWRSRLDKMLITNIAKFRDYDYQKIQDLLRVIRNKVSSSPLLSIIVWDANGECRNITIKVYPHISRNV